MTMALAVATTLPTACLALSQRAARPISATEIAVLHDDSVQAYWRGETKTVEFAAWLARFWEPSLSVTLKTPAAISVYGCGGRGIRWHETDDAIVGVTPGVFGGYRIPISARPPLGDVASQAKLADSESIPSART